MSKTVPLQTIQFSISMQFECKYSLIVQKFLFQAIQFSPTVLIPTIQFSISMLLVLFNPEIGPYQVLPFRVRVDRGAMAMKWCSAFPKAPESLEPHHQIIQCHIQDTYWGRGLIMQSVYSIVPTDWAIHRVNVKTVLFKIIQLSISTQFRCQNSSILNNSV